LDDAVVELYGVPYGRGGVGCAEVRVWEGLVGCDEGGEEWVEVVCA
jgi:hypothetical protein